MLAARIVDVFEETRANIDASVPLDAGPDRLSSPHRGDT